MKGVFGQTRPEHTLHFAGAMLGDANWCTEHSIDTCSLQDRISQYIRTERIGYGYGALAAGADLLIAGSLLKEGRALTVYLPCKEDAFIEHSVRPYGSEWVERYEHCRDQAEAVHSVTHNPEANDWFDRALASRTAMGISIVQAQALGATAHQLCIVNPANPVRTRGTWANIDEWRRTGNAQRIIELNWPSPSRKSTAPQKSLDVEERQMVALICADVVGFGSLSDRQANAFIPKVFDPLAAACANLRYGPLYANSWGDGLLLAFDDIGAGAEAAQVLQACFSSINLAQAGMPTTLGLRVAGHFGPVHWVNDPFQRRRAVFGTHITLASRIEQKSDAGSVLVSEGFAAALALSEQAHLYRCLPLGKRTLSKGAGDWPLYRLSPIDS